MKNLETKKIPAHFVLPLGSDQSGSHRLYSLEIQVLDESAPCEISLFADSRYRLWVNGQVVAYGPARFHPSHPEYDSHEISSLFVKGSNRIMVETWTVHEHNYQMMPGCPGFIAWCSHGDHQLSTPGQWMGKDAHSRCENSPLYSFAIPRTEILDHSSWKEEIDQQSDEWQSCVTIDDQHWGELLPRSCSYASSEHIYPKRITNELIADDEVSFGFHHNFSSLEVREKWVLPVACILISPEEQEVDIALFWGRNYVNGQAITPLKSLAAGNKELFSVKLRKGENLIYSEIEALGESWGYQIGYGKNTGLHCKSSKSGEMFFYLGEIRRPSTLSTVDVPKASVDLSGNYSKVESINAESFPSRQVAWERPISNMKSSCLPITKFKDRDMIIALDFQRTWTGHPIIKLECQDECIVDVSYDESLQDNGVLNLYQKSHLVNSTDRYILGAGVHQIEVLPERGGRYLQLNIRGGGLVTVTSVSIRLSTQKIELVSPIHTDSRFEKELIKMSQETLASTYAECFNDSPWREQGMYIGDHLVQCLAMSCMNEDLSVFKRCIQLYAYCQRKDGHIPPVCPGHYEGYLDDFSLLWIILLDEYYKRSGDLMLVEDMLPTAKRILDSRLWIREDGLIGAQSAFIDWGVTKEARANGEVGSAITALYAGASGIYIQWLVELGQVSEAEQREDELRGLRVAFHNAFWDEQAEFYRSHLGDDATCSLHSNIWALQFGLYPHAQAEFQLLKSIKTLLWSDLSNITKHQLHDGHIELYFSYFMNQALATYGEMELLEAYMEKTYGLMTNQKSMNLWETYCEGQKNLGSLCHGWSAAPIIFFHQNWLGVSHLNPTEPNHIHISPQSFCHRSCKGQYPHQKGLVNISWVADIEQKILDVRVKAPKGLKISSSPGAYFSDYQIVLSIDK